MWKTLTEGRDSPRKEFLVNYDPILDGAAVRFGDWKLLYSKSACVLAVTAVVLSLSYLLSLIILSVFNKISISNCKFASSFSLNF